MQAYYDLSTSSFTISQSRELINVLLNIGQLQRNLFLNWIKDVAHKSINKNIFRKFICSMMSSVYCL